MKFGLFSNNRRPTRSLGDAWEEDIFEIVTADRLGFEEVWVSEHQTPAELIIAKAAALTSRIRMGSGVRPLGYYHPIQIALEANATDQLTNGRYMLGVGHGFHARQMEWRGRDPNDTRAMVQASLDLILRLWNAKAPLDYDGPFWAGKQMVLQCPPVQQPHPPVAIACITSPSSVELAGQYDLMMLTGDFIPTPRLRKFGDILLQSQQAAGHNVTRNRIRATRVIYVAESDKQCARRHARVLRGDHRLGNRQHAPPPGRAHSCRRRRYTTSPSITLSIRGIFSSGRQRPFTGA